MVPLTSLTSTVFPHVRPLPFQIARGHPLMEPQNAFRERHGLMGRRHNKALTQSPLGGRLGAATGYAGLFLASPTRK